MVRFQLLHVLGPLLTLAFYSLVFFRFAPSADTWFVPLLLYDVGPLQILASDTLLQSQLCSLLILVPDSLPLSDSHPC